MRQAIGRGKDLVGDLDRALRRVEQARGQRILQVIPQNGVVSFSDVGDPAAEHVGVHPGHALHDHGLQVRVIPRTESENVLSSTLVTEYGGLLAVVPPWKLSVALAHTVCERD